MTIKDFKQLAPTINPLTEAENQANLRSKKLLTGPDKKDLLAIQYDGAKEYNATPNPYLSPKATPAPSVPQKNNYTKEELILWLTNLLGIFFAWDRQDVDELKTVLEQFSKYIIEFNEKNKGVFFAPNTPRISKDLEIFSKVAKNIDFGSLKQRNANILEATHKTIEEGVETKFLEI